MAADIAFKIMGVIEGVYQINQTLCDGILLAYKNKSDLLPIMMKEDKYFYLFHINVLPTFN